MAFRLRICRNNTTDLLRDTFHATPVTPPESTIRPLFVLSRLDGRVSRRGDLKFLFPKKYHKSLNLEFSHHRVADTALQRTQKVDMGMGVQIMGALLQGFQIDTAPVTAALRGAREISFSFTNIERISVDVNELGAVLSGKALDLDNASAKIFLGENPAEMLLVTDVLSSNTMAVNTESASGQDFKINLEALEAAIASANLDVKVKKHQENSIVFQGEQALTFAFTCIRVYVDPQTGTLTLGESVEVRGSRGGEAGPGTSAPEPAYEQLDDDVMTPGFLSWDEDDTNDVQ